MYSFRSLLCSISKKSKKKPKNATKVIRILNYRNNMRISHGLPVLMGRLPKICSHRDKRECSGECFNWVRMLHNLDTWHEAQSIHTYFKFTVKLKPGWNTLDFFVFDVIKMRLRFRLEFVPLSTTRLIRPLYITCQPDQTEHPDKMFQDGQFQGPENEKCDIEEGKRKISLAMLMAQSFYASYVPKHATFQMKLDQKGMPIVEHVHLEVPRSRLVKLSMGDAWMFLAKLLRSWSKYGQGEKYVVFVSYSRYTYDGNPVGIRTNYERIFQMTEGFIALAAGQFAIVSTCALFTWPSHIDEIVKRFQNSDMINPKKFICDSAGNPHTYGGMYATTFGSLIHEMGHIFDLGHDSQGMMGRDFEYINYFFESLDPIFWNKLKKWDRPSLYLLRSCTFLNSWETQQTRLKMRNNFSLSGCESPYNEKHKFLCYKHDHPYLSSKYGIVFVQYRDKDDLTIYARQFTVPRNKIKLRDYSEDRRYVGEPRIKEKLFHGRRECGITIVVVDILGNRFFIA